MAMQSGGSPDGIQVFFLEEGGQSAADVAGKIA